MNNNHASYRSRSPISSPYQLKPKNPIQALHEKTYDLTEDHPVRSAVRVLCTTFQLSVSFTEDTASLSEMSGIPGLLAIKCVIRKDKQIIGIGRGWSTISRINRSIDRSTMAAVNGSFLSACNNSCKSLDALRLSDTTEAEVSFEDPATPKQIDYLQQLLSGASEAQRDRWMPNLSTLTRSDASEAIASLKR